MRNPIRESDHFDNQLIPSNPYGPFRYHQNYVDAFMNVLNRSIAKHCKILVVRFDLRFPEDMNCYDANKVLGRFINVYRLQLKDLDPEYVIRREQTRNGSNPHYHCCYFLNGSVAQRSVYYKQIAEDTWNHVLQLPFTGKGLVEYCQRDRFGNPYGELMIRRQSQESGTTLEEVSEYQTAVRIISYMAKYLEEDITESCIRKIFCSQCN